MKAPQKPESRPTAPSVHTEDAEHLPSVDLETPASSVSDETPVAVVPTAKDRLRATYGKPAA